MNGCQWAWTWRPRHSFTLQALVNQMVAYIHYERLSVGMDLATTPPVCTILLLNQMVAYTHYERLSVGMDLTTTPLIYTILLPNQMVACIHYEQVSVGMDLTTTPLSLNKSDNVKQQQRAWKQVRVGLARTVYIHRI
jgi:hypothetical protein